MKIKIYTVIWKFMIAVLKTATDRIIELLKLRAFCMLELFL